ncbi:NAD(P)/FAD-dependent oxidoreductase [Saccharothrix sp. AJ9571]|nr:NAD(P)/FAD-dependent oxidoreductase [Saccharothrix sp. AJ9571]
MSGEPDVVVVGSGPNGLAAAVVLARAGLRVQVREAAAEIGGGLRSLPLFDQDVVHDICSAVHPMANASRFFREFDLAARGVELRVPAVAYAHPIEGAESAIAYTDLAATCGRLGVDAPLWRRLMGPLAERSTQLVDLLLGDGRHFPLDPRTALLLPPRVLAHGSFLAKRAFAGKRAPALLSGVAAHSVTALPSLSGGGSALLLGHLAHATGWPIPVGGSRRIAEAMVDDLRRHGGSVVTEAPVTDLRELRKTPAILLDVTGKTLLDLGDQLLPAKASRRLRRAKNGPGAAKVDFLVSEPIPWLDPEIARAGTVHLGGTREQVYAAETDVARGRRASEPFTLVAEPMVTDPGRGLPGRRPVWAYCHVPHDDRADPVEVITRRIERYAPGFADTVLAARGVSAHELGEYNPNYVGGDIGAGAITPFRLVSGPFPGWDPYRTPLGGVYFCSAATPPGPGVHGMAGYHAARSVLRREFGVHEVPDLAPRQQGVNNTGGPVSRP